VKEFQVPIALKINLTLVNASSPLKALADVTLSWEGQVLRIRRCCVFERSGSPPWANFPTIGVKEDGKKKFLLLIDLSPELKKRVLMGLLAEYRKVSLGP
jgi:hypothetical protein